MAFINRVRLPFKLTRPQFLEERDVHRKANGVIKVLSVVIRKQYEGETDLWPEKWHERFKIALAHDNVSIEGEKYIGDIVQDGDYTINWVDFLDYPIAKATFKILATPFDATNSNCGICGDDFIQVETNDDNIGEIEEDTEFDVDILANDSICCDPITITIVSFNSSYVQSVTVNGDNTLHFVLKDDLVTQNNVVLATYRAECENGQFDEANVIADATGSSEAECLSPTGLASTSIEDTEASFNWDDVVGAASYDWQLFLDTDLINPVQTGNTITSDVDISGLLPETNYVLFVRTNCDNDLSSNFAQLPFTTNEAECDETCGLYRLTMDDGSGDTSHFSNVQYTDCDGNIQSQIVPNQFSTFVCALQNSEGDPVFINNPSSVTIEYMSLCC